MTRKNPIANKSSQALRHRIIFFAKKTSIRQPERRAMASPCPAHLPASVPRLRPGAGKKTARSTAQAGPDVAEQRAKQRIRDQKHFGKSTIEDAKVFLATPDEHKNLFGYAKSSDAIFSGRVFREPS